MPGRIRTCILCRPTSMPLSPLCSLPHAHGNPPHPPKPTEAPTSAVPSQSSPSRICALGPAVWSLCPRSRPTTTVNFVYAGEPKATRNTLVVTPSQLQGQRPLERESGSLLRCWDRQLLDDSPGCLLTRCLLCSDVVTQRPGFCLVSHGGSESLMVIFCGVAHAQQATPQPGWDPGGCRGCFPLFPSAYFSPLLDWSPVEDLPLPVLPHDIFPRTHGHANNCTAKISIETASCRARNGVRRVRQVQGGEGEEGKEGEAGAG